jgi:deazaflavin-dependent oxidoreductase (nitroreductase family)
VPSDEEFLAYNETVVDEFRAKGGRVAQLDFPVLLLTTTGARTGRQTTVPLGYGVDEERLFVVASKAGAPTNPAWFHNLLANPSVTVEIGTSTYEARARVTEGGERDRLYRMVAAGSPGSLGLRAEKSPPVPRHRAGGGPSASTPFFLMP